MEILIIYEEEEQIMLLEFVQKLILGLEKADLSSSAVCILHALLISFKQLLSSHLIAWAVISAQLLVCNFKKSPSADLCVKFTHAGAKFVPHAMSLTEQY